MVRCRIRSGDKFSPSCLRSSKGGILSAQGSRLAIEDIKRSLHSCIVLLCHHSHLSSQSGVTFDLGRDDSTVADTIFRDTMRSVSEKYSFRRLRARRKMNRLLKKAYGRDENSALRVAENDIEKLDEGVGWKRSVFVSSQGMPSVRPLRPEVVKLTGSWTIIDSSELFFKGPRSAPALVHLQRTLRWFQLDNYWEFAVTYRGQTAYFISSKWWDADTAFEVSRHGLALGFGEVPSRFIAIVPRKMVNLLLEENDEAELDGGVSVDVDGELICSGDGDFVVSGCGSGDASPERKVSRWIEDECVQNADILCCAGGRWSYCDDSSEEEQEDQETERFLMDDSSGEEEQETKRFPMDDCDGELVM